MSPFFSKDTNRGNGAEHLNRQVLLLNPLGEAYSIATDSQRSTHLQSQVREANEMIEDLCRWFGDELKLHSKLSIYVHRAQSLRSELGAALGAMNREIAIYENQSTHSGTPSYRARIAAFNSMIERLYTFHQEVQGVAQKMR